MAATSSSLATVVHIYRFKLGKTSVPQGLRVKLSAGDSTWRAELRAAALAAWNKETVAMSAKAIAPAHAVPVAMNQDLYMVYLIHPNAGILSMTVIAVEFWRP
jgi:hypothetical protein